MTIEWATFIAELASNPVLVAVTLLNIGVIVVNGATDAPNAIATVVSTRAMKPKFAILMAAVCNFLGLLLVSLVTSAVAHTIFNMVDFGGNSQQALIALTAAMIAIIVWGAAAWWFFLRTPPPAPDALKPEVIVVPSKPTVKTKPDYIKEFAPFLVPRDDGKSKTRFLVCKFSAVSKDAGLGKEMDQKMISLRDAMYYYLRSKSNEYLMDPRNGPAIKQDLTSVLNDYLTHGKIEDILFESYLNE